MKADEMLLGIIAVAAVGYAYFVTKKVERVAKRLDTTVDDISHNATVEVPETIVNEAVHIAADRAARLAVKEITNNIVSGMRNDIQKEVKVNVETEKAKISEKVTKEITRQVTNIDISDLKTQVMVESKEAMLQKLDGSMDSILSTFNTNLENVSKIYSSIASSVPGVKGNDTGLVFRVGQ